MTSPARRHFLKVTAELESSAVNQDTARSGYELMLQQLGIHKRQLKQIQSTKLKADFKLKILPEYKPWLDGVLEKGEGIQDEVVMTWLTWAIDCEQYELAIRIGAYALEHNLLMPTQFKRPTATLLAEEFANEANTARIAQQDFDLELLLQVDALIKDKDIVDQVKAKLYKEIGLLYGEEHPELALEFLTTATGLDKSVGVKKERDRLQKLIDNKSTE